MSTWPLVKLDRPARLRLRYPTCGACEVEVDSDGDGWQCPVCGTSWPYQAGDDDEGELYEAWSGEVLGLLPVTHDEARQVAFRWEQRKHAEFMASLRSKQTS